MKRYIASREAHTGTSGFTNYWGCSQADIDRTLEKVSQDYPNSVVVDGSDDWNSPKHKRPENFQCEKLALFHSGISGISSSGIVVSPEEYAKLSEWYEKTFSRNIETSCNIYNVSNR